MTYSELLQSIDLAYSIISDRLEKAKIDYEQLGQVFDRVHYEDVSLDDIMDAILLPLLPDVIDRYASIPLQYRIKAYRVYVASLCELVKNGLVNGGILKTMDARIGFEFDRNHHYDLLQKALKYEGIQVFENKYRKYEETIINEAGIPRNYHTKCLEIFTLYWKWLRNFDFAERKAFLVDYFDDRALNKIYIVDRNDSLRFAYLKEETKSFSQKVIKTCIKLDAVFSAIDNYPDTITEDNINDAAAEISSIVGFNIFSVVRSTNIRDYILSYAKQVSFLKFERILSSMPGSEEIELPNGTTKRVSDYHRFNYIGGRHLIRGNAYEVSFPISLSIGELFALPMQNIHMIGNAVLYTSDEPIIAEIDGVGKPCRTFVNLKHDYRYIFYERIAAGSFAYIDGIPVDIINSFSRKTYIGKYWDQELHQYKLGLFIANIRFADEKETMRPVSLECNGKTCISSSTNHNGSFRIQDKLCILEDDAFLRSIQLTFSVNEKIIETWELVPEDMYFWNMQTGVRVYDKIDLSTWFGPPLGLLFSKEPIQHCSVEYSFQYQSNGYYVYTLNLDFSKSNCNINDRVFSIQKSETPYLTLKGKMDVISGEYCIEERDPISIDVLNYTDDITDCYLLIEHDMSVASYNLKNLSFEDYYDVSRLIENRKSGGGIDLGKAGKWNLALVQNGKRISELNIVVVPYLIISSLKPYYAEGEDVLVEIATRSACFEAEGEYSQSKTLNIGKASIVMDGNHVGSGLIEFDCYIDKCGITKQLKFIPRVWGLRKKEVGHDAWEMITSGKMTHSDLNSYNVFVCSTAEADITIITNNKNSIRHVQPGYNRINLRDIIETWLQRTEVTFEDEYKQRQVICIHYYPKVTVINAIRKSDGLMLTICYQGPISSTLSVRVFSGTQKVASTVRQVYSHQFNMQIRVYPQLLKSSEITVEARIEEQDFQKIFHDFCDIVQEQPSKTRIVLSRDTKLLDLISFSTSIPKKSALSKPTTLLQLLANRGENND